jgi:hypothetical protein
MAISSSAADHAQRMTWCCTQDSWTDSGERQQRRRTSLRGVKPSSSESPSSSALDRQNFSTRLVFPACHRHAQSRALRSIHIAGKTVVVIRSRAHRSIAKEEDGAVLELDPPGRLIQQALFGHQGHVRFQREANTAVK